MKKRLEKDNEYEVIIMLSDGSAVTRFEENDKIIWKEKDKILNKVTKDSIEKLERNLKAGKFRGTIQIYTVYRYFEIEENIQQWDEEEQEYKTEKYALIEKKETELFEIIKF